MKNHLSIYEHVGMTLTLAVLVIAVATIARGGTLPDPQSTPGAVDARVTAENVQATICRPGWAASSRVAERISEGAKFQQLRTSIYAEAGNPISAFEEDHLIPLELGGAPDSERNLWPQPRQSYRPSVGPWTAERKDRLENELHARVCRGELDLNAARRCIASNWIACYGTTLGLPR